MIGHELETPDGEAMVRVVRALGQHRYVAGRLHLVHVFVVEAASESVNAEITAALTGAVSWAEATLADPDIDKDSKDERLYRRVTDAELVAILRVFWTPGDDRERASVRLAERLVEIEVEPPDLESLPFDESREEEMFPVLVDAGWELLALGDLDVERHKGAIAAFDDPMAFDVAKFEEESQVEKEAALMELPAMGAVELLAAVDADGLSRAPFVVWTNGNETYVDYLLRGVRRAAKLAD